MGQPIPLTTLLSQILVAFTIEFDNEAEHRLQHRTSRGVSTAVGLHAPWLVSMVMWFNCMQHLGDGPMALRELERRARTPTNLHGMQRWGYIRVTNDEGEATDSGPRPRRANSVVFATPAGAAARRIWADLFGVIEERWRERFGVIEVDALRNAAGAIVKELDPSLPDCMPILGYGLRNERPAKKSPPAATDLPDVEALEFPSRLAKILHAIALEFESESRLSLAICADVVRVLNSEGVRVRDLPGLSGVSKEALAMAFGILSKGRLATVEKESGQSPLQIARLTEAGLRVQRSFPVRLNTIEKRWEERFGGEAMRSLRDAAETIARDPGNGGSLLMQCVEPYPDGWRAAVAKPRVLPHFPMVLHRGGYPDGS